MPKKLCTMAPPVMQTVMRAASSVPSIVSLPTAL
jgi:hypothetical protein